MEVQIGEYKSEDTIREIQFGKHQSETYESNKYTLENKNRKIQINELQPALIRIG